MKLCTLKSILIPILLLLGTPLLRAQFDDVYYDPDNLHYPSNYHQEERQPSPNPTDEYGVTYYDDDAYDYYDDYDYYYSSRIRRFHNFYIGFDFFAPAFTSYYYYDPYYSNAYYYPGSSIYVNFGNWSYWNYNSWCSWNNWNYYNPYNNWCVTPYNYYYGYNGWYGGNYNYWGGCNGYYSYGNYYNNYYYGCPYPVGNYYGIDHNTCASVNDGNQRGYYYGPRTTGNTGSSPRGPIQPPGVTQPVMEGRDLAEQRDQPVSAVPRGVPGDQSPSNPTGNGVDEQPASITLTLDDAVAQANKEIPVDNELKRDPVPGPKRPVFKPETQRFEPYPAHRTEEVASTDPKPVIDRPVYRPYTPDHTSKPASIDQPTIKTDTDRSNYTPNRDHQKPVLKPSDSGRSDRPTYTPPTRSDDRPSYTPAPRNNNSERSNDRPTYSPPPRSHPSESGDRPSGSSRNYDEKPSNNSRSESPSQGSSSRASSSGSNHSSSGNSSSGRSSGSSSSSRSSSGGSSSGHSGSSSGSSPRGRG